MVSRSTLRAVFTLSVKSSFPSELVFIMFFRGCINTYRLTKLCENLITPSVQIELHTQTTGNLPIAPISVRVNGALVMFLLGILPEKSICLFFVNSVETGKLIVDSNWFFNFLPELALTVKELHLFSMSLRIPDHKNIMPWATFPSNRDDRSAVLPQPVFQLLENDKIIACNQSSEIFG